MKKILISWLSVLNDFETNGSVNTMGPTLNMHAHHWDYEKHIILYTPDYKDKARIMISYLKQYFLHHPTELKLMRIELVYTDLSSIQSKMEALLFEYADYEIDLLLSTGTGLMKIVWYALHTTLKLKTSLKVILAPCDSKDYFIPDLIEIKVEQSATPVSAMMREYNLAKKDSHDNYFMTKSLEEVYSNAKKISYADNVSVLILGSTGTGKEVLANYIHKNSARKHKKFIAINCSAFSDQLLESRLFGHRKGSFTGAFDNYKGIFEQANGGTVFLDEIGDISPYMQQSLLRFLQENEIQPIGGNVKKVDVRIIAATNQNIEELIQKKKFRADLFFRLGVILNLPDFFTFSVDEKIQWLNYFIELKKNEFKRNLPITLSENLKNFLLDYRFPGNIRELANIFDNLYVFCEKEADINNLPYYIKNDEISDYSLKLDDIEQMHIKKVLKICNYNKSKAAKLLGIALNTLKNKIAE